jgi:hypothetical protein
MNRHKSLIPAGERNSDTPVVCLCRGTIFTSHSE